MILQSSPNSCCDFSQKNLVFTPLGLCPCGDNTHHSRVLIKTHHKNVIFKKNLRWVFHKTRACVTGGTGNGNPQHPFNVDAARRGAKSIVLNQFSSCEFDHDNSSSSNSDVSSSSNNNSSYYRSSFTEDPFVDKLRTQLGVIHPIPSPQMNGNIVGLFAFFFFVGVVFDKVWTGRKRSPSLQSKLATWPQVPANLSMFLEKDLQRKESVEWVNMVLSKLWKVYRGGIENWIIGLLQPVIDNLKKPDYVERVEIKQFSLGDEPLSVRSVERRTSRRVNDLQYQIGLRYTGGARMLLMLSLKFGLLPIVMPVGVRDFDIDGELWVKLRLIPTEPWVGAVSWAFVSLPKIKFELSPFRLFNLMAIPVLSKFLTKLLTEDLPKLFVRPKKIVLDFQKGKTVGPVPNDSRSGEIQERDNDFAGELSVTLVDARDLTYIFYGKTDPYVILKLGDKVIRSKRNSQTTVIGPPGQPIWNQDFQMFVANPKKEKLCIEVKDTVGFADLTVGTGEVDLVSLKDTVPTDRIVPLRGGWSPFGNRSAGEILVRLTYRAYIEDEEDERVEKRSEETDVSDDELFDSDESVAATSGKDYSAEMEKESFMDVLAALIVSEEFRGIVTSDTMNPSKSTDSSSIADSSSKSDGSPAQPVSESDSSSSIGSALFWFAVITSITVLIAINMDGSNLFNP